jgi:hypothetical protein
MKFVMPSGAWVLISIIIVSLSISIMFSSSRVEGFYEGLGIVPVNAQKVIDAVKSSKSPIDKFNEIKQIGITDPDFKNEIASTEQIIGESVKKMGDLAVAGLAAAKASTAKAPAGKAPAAKGPAGPTKAPTAPPAGPTKAPTAPPAGPSKAPTAPPAPTAGTARPAVVPTAGTARPPVPPTAGTARPPAPPTAGTARPPAPPAPIQRR